MTAHFKHVSKREVGYDVDQVDTVISEARAVFAKLSEAVVEDTFIRHAQFKLAKGGYDIESVDAALDRLDDAIGSQSAKNLVSKAGLESASEQLANLRETLVSRINRGKNKQFKRAGLLSKGYNRRQVSEALKTIDSHIGGHGRLTAQQLREIKFKAVWGGYDEQQVDAFLDRTIDFTYLETAIAAAPRW